MLKSGSNEALRIIVRGYANTVADATDATLSALSVSGATLSPTFDAATTDLLDAVVANAVTQVTITATTSETTATIEYLDGSDNTRTDADTMTAGLQVNLSVGTNTVKVKVTAPDTERPRRPIPSTCCAAPFPPHAASRRCTNLDLDGKPDGGNSDSSPATHSMVGMTVDPYTGASLDG